MEDGKLDPAAAPAIIISGVHGLFFIFVLPMKPKIIPVMSSNEPTMGDATVFINPTPMIIINVPITSRDIYFRVIIET